MEKKQSSVEWYAKASHELIVKKSNGEITEREFLTMHHNLFYDAEAMHKEEVKESYREGRTDQQSASDSFYNRNAESYFNEKFGGEQ